MKGLVQLYVQQFRTTLAMMLQYRASLIIWMIGHVLEPLVYLIVWSVVAASEGGSVGDYAARDFAAYFIVLMLVNHATYTWVMYDFEYRVRHGSLSFALLKPVHPVHSDVADNLSSKLITLPFMLVVAGVLALIFHPALPLEPWTIGLFVPAILLAFLVRFLLEWTLAQAAFWTTRVDAINQTYFVLLLFLSGQIMPITLMPHPIRVVAEILPFRAMVGFPVELVLGRLTMNEALLGLGIQVAWVIVGLILLRVVWRAGVRVYSAVGS
ncbi:MAG: ABC-2 family transporter protein [Dehalococcoidia bacterium]|nr:ABC-2 family transporter protein [Dehalococcoidia bacterium]